MQWAKRKLHYSAVVLLVVSSLRCASADEYADAVETIKKAASLAREALVSARMSGTFRIAKSGTVLQQGTFTAEFKDERYRLELCYEVAPRLHKKDTRLVAICDGATFLVACFFNHEPGCRGAVHNTRSFENIVGWPVAPNRLNGAMLNPSTFDE